MTLERRPIPSAPAYFVDAGAAVYSPNGRRLKTSTVRGYLRVSICRQSRYVHQLVCEAFHGPRPSPRHHAAHSDGVRTHNAPDNLRWATPQENADDRIAHGNSGRGEQHAQSLLTEDEVKAIRKTYAASMGARYVRRGTRERLASQFGVSIGAIKDIIAGRSWKHTLIDVPFLPPPDLPSLKEGQ